MDAPASDRSARLPALDGVRAIAVLAVVFFHSGALPGGWVGVNVFFALSGYLITRILLDARATGAATKSILIPFYARRALRILPLAFLVAAIVGILTHAGWSTLWYVSYIQNWLPNPGPPRELGHYWSLAVEEQFYLVWPFVILYTPARRLVAACVFVVAVDSAFRAALFHWEPSFATAHFLGNATLVRADPIAAGALIAVLGAQGGLQRFRRLLLPAVLGGLIAYGLALHWEAANTHTLRAYVIEEPALALVIGALLVAILLHPPQWLAQKQLGGVGTISYGIYVVHGAISPALRTSVASVPLRLALLLTISLGLAAASWRLFEAPILRQKWRWPMPRHTR